MSEKLRILVVDDESGMRSGVARALRDFTVRAADVNGECSFIVEQAQSGEQALEILLAADAVAASGAAAGVGPATASGPAVIGPSHVDILLLDHKLPGISGLEVLERISGRVDNMVTVMITAYASLETAISAIKRGAYDFLAKPFTPAELKSTIRKAAESLIMARQARRLAQEKRQVRFQFTSVLAHELKAPLAAIEGYLHLIKDKSAGDSWATYDHMLARSLIRVEGMRKMIGDLLDLTRIESGQKKRELLDVDMGELAQLAIETASAQATENSVTIDLEVHGDAHLRSDRGEMEIILNNLISNAVKYNRPGGKVSVAIATQPSGLKITVSDTGIGMSSQECSRLFNDFVRIRNDKTRNIVGSGLGLSIVKKLALLYGGDVTVSSQSDIGSTFTVTLSPADGKAVSQ